ncbi:MAG: BamA/TamA family outer membrane protein, partial [Gammaproteobacteria bacterium]|nr:BamA/TamA family outer membrane protein [Gammaproteobacteria bacterium]
IGNAFEIGLLRRRSKGAGTKDWLSWYRLRYEHRRIELTEGELGPFESGRNLELAVGIGRNQVNLEKYRRRGHVYGTSLSLGLDTLGADYRYQRIDAFYRGYRPIEASTLTNVNYNVELGYSNGEPFGDRAFSIGGGESLRGLEQRSVDGDVKLLLNLEYLKALADHPSVRFAGFWDVANVFPRWDFKPVHTENGIGVGLRWKIVSFVQVDLRVDYAVSLSEKKGYTYFATNLNF